MTNQDPSDRVKTLSLIGGWGGPNLLEVLTEVFRHYLYNVFIAYYETQSPNRRTGLSKVSRFLKHTRTPKGSRVRDGTEFHLLL